VNEIYKIIISNANWHCDYDTHGGQSGQFLSEITALIYKGNHFLNNRNSDKYEIC
jgi:hypothetical protein